MSASFSLSLLLASVRSSWICSFLLCLSSSSFCSILTWSSAVSNSICNLSLSLFIPSTSSSNIMGGALSTACTVWTWIMSSAGLFKLSFRSAFSLWACIKSLRIFSLSSFAILRPNSASWSLSSNCCISSFSSLFSAINLRFSALTSFSSSRSSRMSFSSSSLSSVNVFTWYWSSLFSLTSLL